MRALGRVEGKLDLLLDLEPRVRSLEKTRAYHTGIGAAVGAIVAFVTTHLGLK